MADEVEKKEPEENNDALEKCIGQFGRWQLIMTILISSLNLPCIFNLYALTFMAGESNSFCAKPVNSQLSEEQWRNLSIVKGDLNGCKIKDFNYSLDFEELRNFETNMTRNCDTWNYDTSHFGSTIISEWDLVCDRSRLVNIAEMMFLVGVAFGGVVCGYISDRFGRKRTIMFSLLATIILGVSIAATPWFTLFLVLRIFLGFFSVSIVFSGLVLCLELVGGKWLTICGCYYMLPAALGYVAISGLAFYIKDWRFLQMAMTATAAAHLPLWWILPESPRWLLTVGQQEKVIETLKQISKFNGKKLPENADTIIQQSMLTGTKESPKASILDLYRTKYLRKISILLYIVWFCVVLAYFGLALNLSNLGGDIYVNSIISGLFEIPATAATMIILLKFGRRWPLTLTTAGAGISCLLAALFDKGSWPQLTFGMISRLVITSSNLVISIYTAELFPTSIRNLGLGSSNVSGGIALLLVPYVWNMAGMDGNTPLVVLGLCGILGALAVLFLPETKGLVEEVAEIEKTSL